MLTPVILGGGVAFFEKVRHAPVALEGPQVFEGAGVVHLRYTVGAAPVSPPRSR